MTINGTCPLQWSAGRLRAQWRTKLLLSVVLTTLFYVFYLGLERVTVFRVWTPPALGLEARIRFAPGWVYIYESAYLVIGLPPLLAATKQELRRYVVGFLLICILSFAIFFVLSV